MTTIRANAGGPLTIFRNRRTWAEFAYALPSGPIGVAGAIATVLTLGYGIAAAITVVGIALLAATNLLSRLAGEGLRRMANGLLGARIPAPAPWRPRPGVLGWTRSCLTDVTAWRARAYLLLKLPIGVLTFACLLGFYGYGVMGLLYPLWRPTLSCNPGSTQCHRGLQFGGWTADRPLGLAAIMIAAALLLLAAPWVIHGVTSLDAAVARRLLGPTAGDAERVAQQQRVVELERSRAVAVDDSAATLRRIERDLHDGTQARLVTLAMNVGLAREKLAEGGDPVEARRLLDSAHATAKEAIVELRDLTRGIHPAGLDDGLATALATLASHSPVPVRVSTALAARPAPSIETIAYFCAAELLTNVAKHSGARSASVDARSGTGRLWLQVCDDGRGGASPDGTGSGLRGLAERVGTVDGALHVDSPAGGPTVVTVELPVRT